MPRLAGMTDQALHRVDQILTELVETIETARAVPMSTSCVIPRERTLDLLDDLREVLPPEMVEARKLVAQRDTVLHDALQVATTSKDEARQQADAIVGEAQNQAEDLRLRAQEQARHLLEAAEAQARELLESARAEHAQLVSATGIHQAAAEEAAALKADAQQFAELTRGEAEHYALRLRADSDAYAEQALVDLLAVLQRTAATAEQGRQALAARQPPAPITD